MAYLITSDFAKLENNDGYKNAKGNSECVIFVQKAANMPHTSTWKRGIKVMEARRGQIAQGTVIATFDDHGNFPDSARHAAMYISHDENAISVFDQWDKQGKVKRRPIRNKKLDKRNVDDAQWYWVVE